MARTFTLLGNRLTLEDTPPKPPEDALWLAASLTPAPNARVLDAMCGPGTVGLALLARCPALRVTALDLDPALATLAARNAARNGFAPRHSAIAADLAAATVGPPFDAAFCNPPYHAVARGHAASTAAKRTAKSLPDGSLATWLEALRRLTAPTATLALIVHATCRPDLETFARQTPCALALTPLQTSPDRPAKRLLARLHKGQPFSLAETPPLPAHDKTLRRKTLEEGHALPLER